MAALILDAGILVDLERSDERARAWLAEARAREDDLLVAGATYAEVWRGHRNGRAHNLSRVLKVVAPVATSEAIGRRAGELIERAEAPKELRMDAIVVATAEHEGGDVVTNDLGDLKLLAAQARSVRVRGI